jgi:hypothetical protein
MAQASETESLQDLKDGTLTGVACAALQAAANKRPALSYFSYNLPKCLLNYAVHAPKIQQPHNWTSKSYCRMQLAHIEPIKLNTVK